MATVGHLRVLGESVWLEQGKYEGAESRHEQALARNRVPRAEGGGSGLCDSIEATMSMIQQSLSAKTQTSRRVDLEQRVCVLEQENLKLKKVVFDLTGRVAALESRLASNKTEEDFDLFDGDEQEVEEREPEPKFIKSKKPPVVAKSTIVLEVKPWSTETDMVGMEKFVRGIASDGLLWGASKLVDVAFGIKKLQISCVVEDEKVGVDFLEDSVTAFEDHVQSVDVVAFNKL